jgi:hypothetical protein
MTEGMKVARLPGMDEKTGRWRTVGEYYAEVDEIKKEQGL